MGHSERHSERETVRDTGRERQWGTVRDTVRDTVRETQWDTVRDKVMHTSTAKKPASRRKQLWYVSRNALFPEDVCSSDWICARRFCR